MTEQRLLYLLKQYKASLCDKQELVELNAWYNSLNYGEKDFEQWIEEVNGENAMAEQLYVKFQLKVKRDARVIKIRRATQIAATIIGLFIIAGLFYSRGYLADKQQQNIVNNKTRIKPGGNKAILTLADGSKIVLDDASNGKIASQAGVSISKSSNGQLIYNFSGAGMPVATSGKMLFNRLYTPRGGQYQVVLPDGSKVWLNSDSELSFPITFNGRDRRVELTGEAYFEVKHMDDVPFKVATAQQEIKVLGTHFNVNGYTDEQDIHTTLLQGSVMVSNLRSGSHQLLVPGQQSNINKSDGAIKVKSVNLDEAVAWKNGYFLFDNRDLKSIMKVISRWYNVDVEFKSINTSEKFGGTFSRSADLSEILTNLQDLGSVHFKTEGRKVIVTR
jgi:transmembrane sensor